MTVGKSMLHGMVPYKDLFEQKGPLLYMVHAFAALISEKTFIGVYFIEIIACIAFLFLSFKIMRLYLPSVNVLTIPILAAIVYSSTSFCHGDSAEELCLPLFSYAIYIAIKCIQSDKAPSWRESLMIGITSSCVLWIKYSMLGIYLGWFLILAYYLIRHGKLKKVISMTALIAVGVLLPTIPILIYFYTNDALNDLWTVYFYDNIFLYSSTSDDQFILLSLIDNLKIGFKNIRVFSLISAKLMVIGGIALAKKKEKSEFTSYVCMLFFAILLIYMGGQGHRYSSLVLGAFVPIGIIAVYQIIKNCLSSIECVGLTKLNPVRLFLNIVVCLVCFITAFTRCNNTYLLQYSKSDMPQYQFAEIISQVEDATLLNYGFLDGGFYTTTGIVPNCKYFCGLNISLPELKETQAEYISAGKVTFVVTRNLELTTDLYECVAQASFYVEGLQCEYYLYQLIQ